MAPDPIFSERKTKQEHCDSWMGPNETRMPKWQIIRQHKADFVVFFLPQEIFKNENLLEINSPA